MRRPSTIIQGERDALRRVAQQYQHGLNEGGDGYNPHSDALRALEAEYEAAAEAECDARCREAQAHEDAIWTRELTQERRVAWNAWVKKQGKTIAAAQIAAFQKTIGFTMLQLQYHIKRHGL